MLITQLQLALIHYFILIIHFEIIDSLLLILLNIIVNLKKIWIDIYFPRGSTFDQSLHVLLKLVLVVGWLYTFELLSLHHLGHIALLLLFLGKVFIIIFHKF